MRWRLAAIVVIMFVEGWVGFIGLLAAWNFVLDGLGLSGVWFAGLPAYACYAMCQAAEGFGRTRELDAQPESPE